MFKLLTTFLGIVQLPLLFLFSFWLFLLARRGKTSKNKIYYPKVTIIIPTFNEEDKIGKCLASIFNSEYPKEKLEVIVVDEGQDKTAEIAKKLGAKVIKVKKAGKAINCNKGLKKAKGEIVIFMDADTRLEKDSIKKLVQPFADKKVGISQGNVLVSNKSSLLTKFQEIEYKFVNKIRDAHLSNRIPFPYVWGCFLAFRKKVLEEIGGFEADTMAEDNDAMIRILKAGYEIAVTKAKAYTNVPTKIAELIKQRLRWLKGTFQLGIKHKDIISLKYGNYFLFLYPFWPIYGLLYFPLLLYLFFFWLFKINNLLDLSIYLLNWFTFLGPFYCLFKLPQWGFEFYILIGCLVGLVSFTLLFLSLNPRGKNLLYLFIFPIYGTFFLNFILFLSSFYIILSKEKKFVR